LELLKVSCKFHATKKVNSHPLNMVLIRKIMGWVDCHLAWFLTNGNKRQRMLD
jgi:hypothetical protein